MPIHLRLPVLLLAFSSAVVDLVASVACIEFVLWWIVWSVAGSTFKGFWCERGCCSSFMFVKFLEIYDGILLPLLCRFQEPLACRFKGLLDTFPVAIEKSKSALCLSMSLQRGRGCLVVFFCFLVTLIHTLTFFVHDTQVVLCRGITLTCG